MADAGGPPLSLTSKDITEIRMTPTERARAFDLRQLDAAFYADPYPVYDALRAIEPIKRMPDGSLFLTRYKDV